MAAIGINWGEVWKPVWKPVWATSIAPVVPSTPAPPSYYHGGGGGGSTNNPKHMRRTSNDAVVREEALAHAHRIEDAMIMEIVVALAASGVLQ